MQSKKKAEKTRRLSPITKKALSNIFSKPATEGYPFVKPKLSDDFRGQPVFDINLCVSCGLCSRNCPAKAIEMVDVNGKNIHNSILANASSVTNVLKTAPKKL